ALVPETVKRLAGGGFEVAVERGAGEAASFPDPDYEQAGAALVDDAYSAEAVVKVQSTPADEAARPRDSQTLIGFLQPLTGRDGSARSSPGSTCGRSCASRSRASAPPSSTSASPAKRRPAATPGS